MKGTISDTPLLPYPIPYSNFFACFIYRIYAHVCMLFFVVVVTLRPEPSRLCLFLPCSGADIVKTEKLRKNNEEEKRKAKAELCVFSYA